MTYSLISCLSLRSEMLPREKGVEGLGLYVMEYDRAFQNLFSLPAQI